MNELYSIDTSEYLDHFGIQGMKWGVRRYQNKDGSLTDLGKARTLEKGSELRRIGMVQGKDPWNDRLYVSTTKEDSAKWDELFSGPNGVRGRRTFESTYKLSKSVKVADMKTQMKVFDEITKKAEANKEQIAADMKLVRDGFPAYKVRDDHDMVSMMFTAGSYTKTGKMFIDTLNKQGYGAVEDYHGKNVADDPVILIGSGVKYAQFRSSVQTEASKTACSDALMRSLGWDF